MVVVFVVGGAGTGRVVNAGTTGSERMRRGGIEIVVGGDGISRRGDLGGDDDSDTLRSLAVGTGRGVVGSVVPGIVIPVVVTGWTVVRGVTCVVVVFVPGGGTGRVVNAGTTGSERIRRGGPPRSVDGEHSISPTRRSGRRPGPRRTAIPCSGRRKRRRGFRRSRNRGSRRRDRIDSRQRCHTRGRRLSWSVEALGESSTQAPQARNACGVARLR